VTTPTRVEAPRRSGPGDSILLPGTWVEVLPAAEILRTLDEDQSLDGLPFMPEMLPHCGRRYRVSLRADRTCINPPEIPFRRLHDSVVLDGLRCDGSFHGGCQLGCMFLWKEAWLRKVPSGRPAQPAVEAEDTPALRSTTTSDLERFFCQATELPRATEPGDPIWKPGQYLRFLRVRTLTLPELLAMFGRPLLRRAGWLAGSLIPRRAARPTTIETCLGLEPGEWVEVRSRDEILQTLDERGRHKGLAFSTDMYRQSGRRMQVLKRIERVIVEETGRLNPVHDTVILEGSICDRYRGCARGMPILWREAWLKRVDHRPLAAALESTEAPSVQQG
jgi:hypothetical protein